MTDKKILCAFGVDVDAVAGWLGSYGGEDSPGDVSRGFGPLPARLCGALVGVQSGNRGTTASERDPVRP